MPARKPPERYWRSYGSDPLPTGAEALDEPFAAFPSWLIRITCDRCGKDRMFAETHFAQRDMLLREIIKRMRHDGCGGLVGPRNWSPELRALPVGRCGVSCWCSRAGRPRRLQPTESVTIFSAAG